MKSTATLARENNVKSMRLNNTIEKSLKTI